jgi:hypothetical protein
MLRPCAAEVTGATTPILGVAGCFKAGGYGQSSGAAVATFYALNILRHPQQPLPVSAAPVGLFNGANISPATSKYASGTTSRLDNLFMTPVA